jgi:hypothetical protein
LRLVSHNIEETFRSDALLYVIGQVKMRITEKKRVFGGLCYRVARIKENDDHKPISPAPYLPIAGFNFVHGSLILLNYIFYSSQH